MANEYSPLWFSTFMDAVPEVRTNAEVEGVVRRLPLPEFRRILDICCGSGRHAASLARLGYEVTGIDRDVDALRRALDLAPSVRFLQLDQRKLRRLEEPFDAAIILWQSFGYFDPATNDQVLADVATLLRPGGKLLLDLFHPDSFVHEREERSRARAEGVTISNRVSNGRLLSTIVYADGSKEEMDFELFSPQELTRRATSLGYEVVEQCCWWDELRPPDPSERRYQSVLRRT